MPLFRGWVKTFRNIQNLKQVKGSKIRLKLKLKLNSTVIVYSFIHLSIYCYCFVPHSSEICSFVSSYKMSHHLDCICFCFFFMQLLSNLFVFTIKANRMYWPVLKFVSILLHHLNLKPLSTNSTKWSSVLKQFVGCCWQIVTVCLTICGVCA